MLRFSLKLTTFQADFWYILVMQMSTCLQSQRLSTAVKGAVSPLCDARSGRGLWFLICCAVQAPLTCWSHTFVIVEPWAIGLEEYSSTGMKQKRHEVHCCSVSSGPAALCGGKAECNRNLPLASRWEGKPLLRTSFWGSACSLALKVTLMGNLQGTQGTELYYINGTKRYSAGGAHIRPCHRIALFKK